MACVRRAALRQARATALMRVHTELQRTLLGGRGRAALRGGAAPAAATLDAVRLLQLWDTRGPLAPEVCAALHRVLTVCTRVLTSTWLYSPWLWFSSTSVAHLLLSPVRSTNACSMLCQTS